MTEALARMAKHDPTTQYVAADSQTEKWGKVTFSAQGGAEATAIPE